MISYNDVVLAIDGALDRCEELAETVGRGVSCRELALVKTKLQEARMWMKQAETEKTYDTKSQEF